MLAPIDVFYRCRGDLHAPPLPDSHCFAFSTDTYRQVVSACAQLATIRATRCALDQQDKPLIQTPCLEKALRPDLTAVNIYF